MLEVGNETSVIGLIKKLINDGHGKYLDYNYVDGKYNNKYQEIDNIIDKSTVVALLDVEYNNKTNKTLSRVELLNNKFNDFTMYKCSAGRNNLVININGDVYYCMAHKNHADPVFNIYKNNKMQEISNNRWVVCNYGKCFCEVYLEKRRWDYQATVEIDIK
jgi:MoaA/NifB/PqqE/SkfB family radical SAM enzyme